MSGLYRTEDQWDEWYNNDATPEEKGFFKLIWQYRHHFKDLTFQEAPFTSSIFEDYKTPPIESYISNLKVIVRELKDPHFLASYNSKYHTITVSPQARTKEYCILHEMIHIFDKIYDDIYGLRDAVRWRLYYRLQDKINELDQAILDFTTIRSLMSINCCPENPKRFQQTHDTLFLLKSFDLDIKMGYPFGTVLGYCYAEKFKDLS